MIVKYLSVQNRRPLIEKFKKLFFVFIVACLCFVFVGCTDQTYQIVVNEDNTCDMTLSLITDIDNFNLLNSYKINQENKLIKKESSVNPVEQCEVVFQEAASVFYSYGFDIEPVSDSIQVGFVAKKHYANIESLNKDIKKLYESKFFGANIEIKNAKDLVSSKYSVSGTFEYFYDPDLDIPEELVKNIDSLSDVSALQANLFITLPGESDSDSSGGGASWTAKPKEKPIEVTASSSVVNNRVLIIVAILVIAIIVVIVFVVSRRLKTAKEKRQGSLQSQ